MHESYQKIVMANSNDLIDVIKVGNGQKQKLKRPIADEPLEDNAHAKGKQKLEHFWEEAAQNEEIESLKLKKTFLNNMWTFVMTMFDILDIHLMPIDQTLLHIQHDGTFAKSKKLTLALKQLNPDEILDSICTKLVENITNRNGILKELFEKINLQAQMVFGQLIFRINKNEPVKCERIKDESEKIENKRLKVLYFYLRLLRNLAGLLESPYNGNFPKNNTNVSQSMRKCILSWISTAMGQFFEEFKAVVNGPNITEQQRKIIVMRNFGQLEVAKEVLSMLMFSLGQTLSPLVEGQKHLFNFQSPLFTVLLEDISKNNIACLLMARKEPVDFMQIAQKSAYVTSRYGVAATFLPLLFDSMEPHKDDENSHFTIIKNANVYLKLCKSLLNELENPVFSEEIIKCGTI
uniref:Uncharacterized protein n=1 Tax=Globodera rostochiensis TaxID=31243 RepID=A0A914HLC7_GLORO